MITQLLKLFMYMLCMIYKTHIHIYIYIYIYIYVCTIVTALGALLSLNVDF